MGLLVDGQWQDKWYDTKSSGGRFIRSEAQFRNWITADGKAGPTGNGGFKAAPGRYHLYVSLACPWAHRTLIFRQLKGLSEMISLSVVNPLMLENGWTFAPAEGVIDDTLHNSQYLYQLYQHADPNYTGRVTVPLLWDKQTDQPVSNESSEIIRMFNSAFDETGASEGDFYPTSLRQAIDELNKEIYDTVNNGVYKAGFATTQTAYEQAIEPLFATLDKLEKRLAKQTFLLADSPTEADWRLFTTLIRFDAVYYGHFKCNIRQIKDYPRLSEFVRNLYHWPDVAQTVNFQHIKQHYYGSHKTINPTGIVPVGPELDFTY